MKNKTYVGVMMENSVRYVTHMDARVKQAFWADGKPAKPMSKSAADNLYFGLRCNGYRAVIITMPDYEEPSNPAKEGSK